MCQKVDILPHRHSLMSKCDILTKRKALHGRVEARFAPVVRGTPLHFLPNEISCTVQRNANCHFKAFSRIFQDAQNVLLRQHRTRRRTVVSLGKKVKKMYLVFISIFERIFQGKLFFFFHQGISMGGNYL